MNRSDSRRPEFESAVTTSDGSNFAQLLRDEELLRRAASNKSAADLNLLAPKAEDRQLGQAKPLSVDEISRET
jgi:hypothetical protein